MITSNDRVPSWLKAVILRCLAKHPDDRYPSARAVLDALREGRGATPPSPAPAAGAVDPSVGPSARSEDETPTGAMPVRRRGGLWEGLSGWSEGAADFSPEPSSLAGTG